MRTTQKIVFSVFCFTSCQALVDRASATRFYSNRASVGVRLPFNAARGKGGGSHGRKTGPSTKLSMVTNLRGGSMSPGLAPALVSPLVAAIGLMFWENNWKGSAFSLNLVKNAVASVLFLATLVATGSMPTASAPIGQLSLSAFLGIVIGDCTSIASMKRLGARRYLLVDCLRPVISTAIGVIAFGETISLRIIAGIAAVVAGVYVASSQKVESSSTNTSSKRDIIVGYSLAVIHLLFDTAGAAITKNCSQDKLGPFAIGLLRFGSAAVMLSVIGSVGRFLSPRSKKQGLQWWSIPGIGQDGSDYAMEANAWQAVIVGCFLVTFLAPSLFLRSLLLMPLGIAATLSCLGPLYEPALALIMKGTNINIAAIVGAMLAFAGVGAICL